MDMTPPSEFPGTIISDRGAIFQTNFVDEIKNEFGDGVFISTRDRIAQSMGWTTDLAKASKNPKVLGETLRD